MLFFLNRELTENISQPTNISANHSDLESDIRISTSIQSSSFCHFPEAYTSFTKRVICKVSKQTVQPVYNVCVKTDMWLTL